MNQVLITDSGILAFATTVALIVPLFIIAILVDSSKPSERIGPVDADSKADRVSIRQSRRTLLAIGVGVLVECNSLGAILTTPNDSSEPVPLVNFTYVIFNSLGLLLLFYIIFVPHIELHMSNIRKDPSTARWSIIVGWLVDIGLIFSAANDRFIGDSNVNYLSAYLFLGLSLVFTGAMIAFTLTVVLRGRLKNKKTGDDKTRTDRPEIEP